MYIIIILPRLHTAGHAVYLEQSKALAKKKIVCWNQRSFCEVTFAYFHVFETDTDSITFANGWHLNVNKIDSEFIGLTDPTALSIGHVRWLQHLPAIG